MLTFPCLAFVFSGRSVVVARDKTFFETSTSSRVRAGFWRVPFRIVDLDLREFEARELLILGGRGRWWGWRLSLNREIRIRLDFAPCGPTSLQQVKAMTAAAIINDPTGMWLGGDRSPEELVEVVERSDSIRGLIQELAWPPLSL